MTPGSIVHTDYCRDYNVLKELKYDHRTVNHSIESVADDGGSRLNGGLFGAGAHKVDCAMRTLATTSWSTYGGAIVNSVELF